MFDFEHILIIVLSAVAAAMSWLVLYDNERKTWKAPADPILIGGYAVLFMCLAGVFAIMNFHPFGMAG